MTSNSKSNIDNYDLICPITYQIFRDPVIAGDGHVYERAAIVRWIVEHGTSPLTRQPLNLNELQSDDYLKNLANQRRNSVISSEYVTNLDHAALQRQSSTISYNYNIYVDQPVIIQQHPIPNNNIPSIENTENRYVSHNNCCHRHRCAITSAFMAVILWIGIFLVLFFSGSVFRNSGTSSIVTSTHSRKVALTHYSRLTTNSPTYCRRTDCLKSEYYYYHAVLVEVTRTGFYSFTSNSSIDTYGYIYNHSFDPSNPNWNLLSGNDDGDDNHQFKLIILLHSGTKYVLIVTTFHPNSTGTFSMVVSGPSVVFLTDITILQTIQLRAAHIELNDMWTETGLTVAGGHGKGNESNQLNDPYGLYVDDNQTVYIADFGNDRVMEWKSGATSGQVVVGRNGKGWLDEQLNGPKDVIVDKETDKLIICDSGNEQVVQWPRQGGTDGETIIFYVSCTDLTMDDNGFLYVFDHDRNEVRRWLIRKINRIVMKYDEGQDLFRDQLIYDRNGFADRHHLLYTPKVSNRRVAHSLGRIKQAVSYVSGRRDFGQRFKNLAKHRGVVMDQLGTAYVADCVNNRIMRWPKGAAQGSIIIDGNGKKAESNQLSCPRGLSFDRHGNLYVADARNHRVQRFNIKRSL